MIKDTIDTNKKRRVDEVRTANDRQSSKKSGWVRKDLSTVTREERERADTSGWE